MDRVTGVVLRLPCVEYLSFWFLLHLHQIDLTYTVYPFSFALALFSSSLSRCTDASWARNCSRSLSRSSSTFACCSLAMASCNFKRII